MRNNKYNLFEFNTDFPAQLYLYKLGTIAYHYHSTLELIYVLEGSVIISNQEQYYTLHEDDIYLCNAYNSHELQGENAVILALELDMEKLGVKKEERETIAFDCNSANLINEKSYFDKIKALISSFVKYNLKYQENKKYANLSMIYTLFAELLNKYRVTSNDKVIKTSKNLVKINKIIDYINQNFKSGIGLKDLSQEFNLTVPYLSQFFEKNMGKNFQDYYDEIRINKSMNDLMNTEIPVNILANEYGFSDPRGYVRAFKKIYNSSPSEYRRNISTNKNTDSIFESDFKKTKYLDKLLSIYDTNLQLPVKIVKNSIITDIKCDFDKTTKQLKGNWLKSLTIGHANNLLNHNIRMMLEEAKKDLKFEYVSFIGLLDDSMHVCKKSNNELRYSYVYFDQIFDYILSLGLKPIVQLSFIPKSLAVDDAITYDNSTTIGKPKNYDEYIDLIEHVVLHLIERYGKHNVRSWPFTFWNAPDTTNRAYGFKNDLDFYKLYVMIYKKVKEIDNQIIFGSPALLPLCEETIKWDKNFLKYAQENGAYPDILYIHYYSNDLSEMYKDNPNPEKLSNNPDLLNEVLSFVKQKEFYSGNKIHLTEFNFTTSRRNLLSDTIFNSCYVTKNLLENYDAIDAFGNSILSDIADESMIPEKTFHGGIGLFTYNGIKKSSYYAYKFITSLYNELLHCGKGYFITKAKKGLRIILYNYEHFSPLYASGDYFEISNDDRYAPFENNNVNHFVLNFNNIPNKYSTAIVTQYRLGKDSGSAYDIALEMGLEDILSIDEVSDLDKLSTPKFRTFKTPIQNNSFKIESNVDSLEIKYIKIKFEN